ncbi:MAG TPA: dihydroorotate dehydrogenase electron transfer subunit [bacterium]|nr:dihydroorotate dehydrogenase electron transfer subunit [bacterium]
MQARIIGTEALRAGFNLLRLETPVIARSCLPGQFVLLRGLTPEWPYLRRPFSIYRSDQDATIEIVYKTVGRATAVMANLTEGEYEIVGPLGKGFSLRPGKTHTVALAGGVGLPPVACYCERYVDAIERITLIIGARTARELLVPVGMMAQGIDLRSYTDDGSKGAKGTVVDGFASRLAELGAAAEEVQVIACGPRDMLSAVAGMCRDRGLPCEVSVEEMMACGLGACLSCAVPRLAGGYLHACQDGPVVDSALVDWENWKT